MNKEIANKINASIMDNQMMLDFLGAKKTLTTSEISCLIDTLNRQRNELQLAIELTSKL